MSASGFASFRAFMGGLVDYAGLFPPASLDMASAVAEYSTHHAEPDAWMLGRFIVPAGRLDELLEARNGNLDAGGTWAISLLVGARDNGDGALEAAATQGITAAAFLQKSKDTARIEVLEAPIPAEVSGLARADLEIARRYSNLLHEHGAPRGIVEFTLMPVLLAWATLDRVAEGGPGAKLTRPEVREILTTMETALNEGDLGGLHQRTS